MTLGRTYCDETIEHRDRRRSRARPAAAPFRSPQLRRLVARRAMVAFGLARTGHDDQYDSGGTRSASRDTRGASLGPRRGRRPGVRGCGRAYVFRHSVLVRPGDLVRTVVAEHARRIAGL